MREKLVDIVELMELTGYEDMRSVKQWCSKKKIPLFRIGMRTYTVADFVNLHIQDEVRLFIHSNYSNPDEVLEAVKSGDGEKLKGVIKDEIENNNRAKRNKGSRSEAAQSFLKRINK